MDASPSFAAARSQGAHEARRAWPWWTATVLGTVLLGAAGLLVDEYFAYLATSWLILGLLGLSLDFVWGRAGILSLAQTAFFGLGGYAGAVAAINGGGPLAQSLWVAAPVGALAGAAAASVIGWLLFFGRLGPLQASILTYAATLLLWTCSMSFSAQIGRASVGGDNGLSNIPGLSLGWGDEPLGARGGLLCVLAISALVLLGLRALLRSPFGTVIDCVRLNLPKTELLGYDVRRYQLAAFALGGSIAGLAGALFGAWANYLNPSLFSAQQALLVPIYVLVGGLGTLTGAFVGAAAVGALSYWLGGGVVGGQATLIMGGMLIVLVLYLRGGLLGGLGRLRQAWATRAAPAATAARAGKAPLQVEALRNLRRRQSGATPVLEVRDGIKRFGGVIPVDQVSQVFAPGAVRCLIGPNGAGKSSLLRCLAGVHLLDAGCIVLGGERIERWLPHRRVRHGIATKMQVAHVFGELDVRTNLWIEAYSRSRDATHAGSLCESALAALGLQPLAGRAAADLSHGEQQWLDLGMVLCLEPSVVLLDEPAAGMTPQERGELTQLVRVLVESAVVVVVEHDMAFIRSLDAEVTVLHRGAVFAQGDLASLRRDERVLDIYLGRQHVAGT